MKTAWKSRIRCVNRMCMAGRPSRSASLFMGASLSASMYTCSDLRGLVLDMGGVLFCKGAIKTLGLGYRKYNGLCRQKGGLH